MEQSDFVKVSDHIENVIFSLASTELNAAKLFTLTIQTIEYLEDEYQQLNGEQKKMLLIEGFKDLCDVTKHESLTPEIKNNLKDFVHNDLETVIESVIQLSNGQFQINQRQQAFLIKMVVKVCKCFVKNHNQKMNRP
tara:strand:+ start:3419 stop:3829 length:411 start_codon:yes stop_codon:yes gene_type:complete